MLLERYGVMNAMTASAHLKVTLALIVGFPSRKEISAPYVKIGQIASISDHLLITGSRLVPQY